MSDDIVENAWRAVEFAKSVRKLHARRTKPGRQQREDDLAFALERIRSAMKPLRSAMASFPFGPQTTVAEARYDRVKDASSALQKERRSLWKMQHNVKLRQDAPKRPARR